MSDAKSECEDLLSTAVPFARQMLAEHREFFPFGVTLSEEGEIAQVGVSTEDESPKSSAVMGMLEDTFRNDAICGVIRATAITYDVMIQPPGRDEPQDAVAVALDHRDNYSMVVVFPYSFSEEGELQIEDPFAMDGENRIFPS